MTHEARWVMGREGSLLPRPGSILWASGLHGRSTGALSESELGDEGVGCGELMGRCVGSTRDYRVVALGPPSGRDPDLTG